MRIDVWCLMEDGWCLITLAFGCWLFFFILSLTVLRRFYFVMNGQRACDSQIYCPYTIKVNFLSNLLSLDKILVSLHREKFYIMEVITRRYYADIVDSCHQRYPAPDTAWRERNHSSFSAEIPQRRSRRGLRDDVRAILSVHVTRKKETEKKSPVSGVFFYY